MNVSAAHVRARRALRRSLLRPAPGSLDIADPRRPRPPRRPAPAPPTNQTRARADDDGFYKAQKEKKKSVFPLHVYVLSTVCDSTTRARFFCEKSPGFVIRQAPFRLSPHFRRSISRRATRDPEISRELTFPVFETASRVYFDADWAPQAAPEGESCDPEAG